MTRIVLCFLVLCLFVPSLSHDALGATSTELNLRDFGAVGDGVADDGPAFQAALDALAAAGGGTLFVPEGKYAITTPVIKNFAGLASSITIKGVESLKPVSPPSAPGNELAEGLDLLSEVYPRTGETADAITISGLQALFVKDIAFVGTATARNDAANTLFISDIAKAQIKHSEFYGLSNLLGGSVVSALRSDLEITQCKFLGSIATSGAYAPVVQNLEWYGITVTDTVFLDYGLRPELYGKTGFAAPISWVNIGNAAAVTNHSPRREVVIRNTFLDEGGYWGLSSLPYRYAPASAPIDLIYITGLEMNVSNFRQYGHVFYDARRVFVEKSRYGWSHDAAAAIVVLNVGTAILDNLKLEADATALVADANTEELTVINTNYSDLYSSAHVTNTINTVPEEDPVQYVRGRFVAVLGRDPDPAGHYYWSDLLIHCEDPACMDSNKAALDDYLSKQPAAKFAISGRITDEQHVALAGVNVTLSGSQSVTTTTDSDGNYAFSNLPTSGRYEITPSIDGYVFDATSETFITPSADQIAGFTASKPRPIVKHSISGRVLDTKGEPLAGVTITLAGPVAAITTTSTDGSYSFTDIVEGSNCTVTASKDGYLLAPPAQAFNNLAADVKADFEAALLPVLLTANDSDRAIALELTTFIVDPFPISNTLLSEGRNRTRVVFFGTDLGLLPGEGVEAITAEAEDAAHVKYPLRVEFVNPLPELPAISQLVLRLTGDLEDKGDVWVTIKVHGLTSNKARIIIGHFNDDPTN